MSHRLDKNSKIDYNSNMLGGQKARHVGQIRPKTLQEEGNVVEISL